MGERAVVLFGPPKRTLIVAAGLAGVLVLYGMGKDQQGLAGTEPAMSAMTCRVTVTADILNIRSEPNVNAAKIGAMKQGAETDAEKVVQGGFRKLGENRWAADEFLKPLDGRDCG